MTSMDETALTGWTYSTTMDGGTRGVPSVAHMLGSSCRGALAHENGCKMVIRSLKIGRYADRAAIMHETTKNGSGRP